MDEVQTDTLSECNKNQPQETVDLNSSNENETTCAAARLNGCDESDDPLELMDHADNESIGSNSDVWKGSDSEDDNFDKDHSIETNKENEKASNEQCDVETSKEVVKDDNEKEEVKDSQVSEEKETVAETKTVERESEEAADKDKADQDGEAESAPKEVDKDKTDGDGKAESAQKDTPEILETTEGVDLTKESESEEKSEEQPSEDVSKELPEVKSPKQNGETDKDPLSSQTNENDTEKDPLSLDVDTTKAPEAKPPDQSNEVLDDECPMDYDAEDDDDFDPSLLCPEVSMAVDDNEVVTSNGPVPNDGEVTNSPAPLEPLFSTFVDEVTGAEITFNLTPEELELRKRMYGPTNPIQIAKLHCTACNIHLGSALEGQNNRFVHPLLKVLICKKCYHFYTSGDFDKDEDGSELYCRWCGQGGQVLCCSKCEFVFCKRCIRTNFGRRKMFEIRDSDSWDCFRCNQSQIITQRIACYEFFEYIRREMALASTLNSPEIWSKDHSRCCLAKKRPAENGEEMKKAKKKKGDVDPDYDPKADKVVTTTAQPPPFLATVTVGTPIFPGNQGIILPKPIQILPRFTMPKSKDNDIEFVRQIPAPHVTINTMPRPAYRTIMPTVRAALQPPTLVRISSQPSPSPLLPTANRILGNALQGRAPTSSPIMKHEWFEKTVRAAARVNSHLSYTLTQLNKAQSQAASVEELAVVHNKLQEILSSSINSLIQIRKNLRTEFIAGIKTVRLPSKKAETNDDDVILVSAPTTMPLPSTSTVSQPAKDPLAIEGPSKTDSQKVGAEKPKAYLKVKSFKELQNVPSECITIPDDPPMPAKSDDKAKDVTVEIIRNGDAEGKAESSKDVVDPLAENAPSTSKTSKNPNTVPNGSTSAAEDEASKRSKIVYSVKDEPSVEIKRMMAVKVKLVNDDLEGLQKKLAKKM